MKGIEGLQNHIVIPAKAEIQSTLPLLVGAISQTCATHILPCPETKFAAPLLGSGLRRNNVLWRGIPIEKKRNGCVCDCVQLVQWLRSVRGRIFKLYWGNEMEGLIKGLGLLAVIGTILGAIAGAFGIAFTAYRMGKLKGKETGLIDGQKQGVKDGKQKWVDEGKKKGGETRKQYAEKIADLQKELDRHKNYFDKITTYIRGGEDIWKFHEPIRTKALPGTLPLSPPIVMIANLKGGVGKTTLSANLAAYFDQKIGARVLLVDTDYQASLTTMALASTKRNNNKYPPLSEHMLIGEKEPEDLLNASIPLTPPFDRTYLIPTTWGYGNLENRMMLNWLFNGTKQDVRYNMSKYLLSDEFISNFDIVIVDAPPRMTTGFINALCTSTHLLIPAILDEMSVQGMVNMISMTEKLKPTLFPNLKLLGVVGTMVETQIKLNNREQSALSNMRTQVGQLIGAKDFVFDQHWIPKKAKIAEYAGEDIAYFKDPKIKIIFDSLGDALEAKLQVRKLVQQRARQ